MARWECPAWSRGSTPFNRFYDCKGLRRGALGHLRELSYAWALAPLMVWFFVAYVRRRSASIAAEQARDPIPDWTVGELFYFIDAKVVDDHNWERVGADCLRQTINRTTSRVGAPLSNGNESSRAACVYRYRLLGESTPYIHILGSRFPIRPSRLRFGFDWSRWRRPTIHGHPSKQSCRHDPLEIITGKTGPSGTRPWPRLWRPFRRAGSSPQRRSAPSGTFRSIASP